MRLIATLNAFVEWAERQTYESADPVVGPILCHETYGGLMTGTASTAKGGLDEIGCGPRRTFSPN